MAAPCPHDEHSMASEHHGTLRFDNSYARLPERFYARQSAAAVSDPRLIKLNRALALSLGIDSSWLDSSAALAAFSGREAPAGSDPIASAYAGHQFGGFNPQLGDGRALLLGELLTPGGERFDIQLKGSGRTPFSRGGDGLSPLGPVLREYVISEAMYALGIPTTRSLAAVSTGDRVYREQSLPGAILTRVASSHIRVGTFEFFAARRDREALELLLDHVIDRHYPELRQHEAPVLGLLEASVRAQAELIARWQLVGFIHGVMNTDNTLLSGETIDYGPCAFMDEYDPKTVFSSIDRHGRYAYQNQPRIGAWNQSCLAQALFPLLEGDEEECVEKLRAILEGFEAHYEASFRRLARPKFGLAVDDGGDDELMEEYWSLLEKTGADFTLSFRRLSDLSSQGSEQSVAKLFEFPEVFGPWLSRWRQRLSLEKESPAEIQPAMYRQNPALIPRNHIVDSALKRADEAHFCEFHDLVEALASPFEYREELARFATPPEPEERVCTTFCGT